MTVTETEVDKPPALQFPAPLGSEGKKEDEQPKPPAGDTPPKRRGRPPGSTNKNVLSISRIEDALNEQFTLLGTVVYAFNEYDGSCILTGSPRLAKSLANLCEKNPKVKRNIERMLAGGSYGEVIIAAGLIAVPIMANHELMPPGIKNLYGKAIPEQTEEEEPARPMEPRLGPDEPIAA